MSTSKTHVEITGNIIVHHPIKPQPANANAGVQELLSPDCRDENHTKCDRLAWNTKTDEIDYCDCDCGCDGIGEQDLI